MADYRVDFPTLWIVPSWIEAHCPVPDGFRKGKPMTMADWQLWCTANHYRIRSDVEWNPDAPILGPAFTYRRSQVVGPQKSGKGPWSATIVAAEGVGPVLFAGWAGKGDGYDCRSHGCGCGWEYSYDRGEPMGMPWPTPLIQLTASSEDQVDNVYRPLKEMIKIGPLGDLMRVTEGFVALPNGGEIAPVTSSAASRLGNPVTFVLQDETGLYTKTNKLLEVAETQRRGVAGMSGRSMETTNAWNPAMQSVAQRTFESDAADVFKYFREPPAELNYRNPDQRRRIHEIVYEGSTWVNLDSIEGEAAELLERDAAQAERFFGNRCHAGESIAFDVAKWAANTRKGFEVPAQSLIVLGVDGARFDDAVAVVATDVASGFQWPVSIIERPADAGEDYEHDFEAVDGAVREACDLHRVWRAYIDPQRIEKLVERWQGRWGEKVFIEWHTNRPKQICHAVRNYRVGINAGDITNDGDATMARHIANARRREELVKDDEGRPMSSIQKERPGSPLKIDAAMAGVLSWEARGDAIASGQLAKRVGAGRVWDT